MLGVLICNGNEILAFSIIFHGFQLWLFLSPAVSFPVIIILQYYGLASNSSPFFSPFFFFPFSNDR